MFLLGLDASTNFNFFYIMVFISKEVNTSHKRSNTVFTNGSYYMSLYISK